MKITRENYESYFIDWLDGTLPESKIVEFELFIKQNPDLKSELDGFEEIKLENNENQAFNTDTLKEIPDKLVIDISEEEYKSIALLEGDIHEDILKKTENKGNNKKIHEIYNQIALTKLEVDETIFFPFKNRIKRTFISARIKKTIYTVSTLAAIFLIYFSVSNIKNSNKNLKKQPLFIASVDTLKQNKIKKVADDKVFMENVPKHNKIVKKRKQINKIKTEKKATIPEKRNITNENNTEFIAENSNFELPEKLKTTLEIKNNLNTSLAEIAMAENTKPSRLKNKFWQYTEKAVVVWQTLTESELELDNIYHESGRLNKLNIYAGNLKFSKTFN